MIRRVSDFSNFSSDSLKKIEKVIKDKDKKKIYKVCGNQNEVTIAMKEIKLQGYKSEVEKLGNIFYVYSIMPECIDLKEAEQSGNFKKLAWGRYSFQKASSIGDFEHYNFDDGTIWKVIKDEDGNEVLVKEVDDSDEDKVVRQASLNKKASINVNSTNIAQIIQLVYNDSSTVTNPLVSDMLNDTVFQQNIYSFVSSKLNAVITEKIQTKGIYDQSQIQLVMNLIDNKISDNSISGLNDIDNILSEFVQTNI